MPRMLMSQTLIFLAFSMVTACAHDEQQDMHQRPVYSFENVNMGPSESDTDYRDRDRDRPDAYDTRR